MHGIIIVNQDNSHNEYKIKRLKEEALLLDIELSVMVNNGSLAYIDKSGDVKISLDADFIIYLDKDIYFAKMLEEAGYIVFNDSNFLKTCDDKMFTYISLVNKGIRMPLTMSSPLIYRNEISDNNLLFLDEVIKKIGIPLVVKKMYGSLGLGVYLVNSMDELVKVYKENFMYPMLFQQYIASSFGRSIRVLVIDHQIFGAFERFNKDDFRSNFGKTATSKPIVLEKEYEDMARRVIDALNIKYAGIDILFGEDGPYLCEVNSNAFFEEFEKVTGKNVAKAYLEMIKKEMRNHE